MILLNHNLKKDKPSRFILFFYIIFYTIFAKPGDGKMANPITIESSHI